MSLMKIIRIAVFWLLSVCFSSLGTRLALFHKEWMGHTDTGVHDNMCWKNEGLQAWKFIKTINKIRR